MSRGSKPVIGACAGLLAACVARDTRGPEAPPPRFQPLAVTRLVPRTTAYDVEHYSIDLALDPRSRSIAGRCTIRLWPTEGQIARVELDLDGLDVARVIDRDGRRLAHDHRAARLGVALASPVSPGEPVEFVVEYGGRPRKGLWFTRVRDGVATQAFTHGECEDARGWFPCHDTPADRATCDVRVTMPAHWSSIAAGTRVDRRVDGERVTETWRETFPHPPYLTTLVAGDLVVLEADDHGLPLRFAAAPDLAADLRDAFRETGDVLRWLAEVTGARYPFEKYAQTCVDGFPFGGMENLSATTLTDTVLADPKGRADSGLIGLVAHEAAHQWFGDLLTCADWSHVWLHEGFATYFAALYTERARGSDAFRREMRVALDEWLARDVGTRQRPVVSARARDPLELFFTGHVYQGAAMRLHHLRHVMGDAAFFAGVRAFVARHRGGSVVTADCERALGSAAGTDLGWFFAQWFERPGHPIVRAAFEHDAAAGSSTVRLEQTQDPDLGTFRLPLDVEIVVAGRARLERVVMTEREQTFSFDARPAPDWVRVDPLRTVPMELQERRPVREWLSIAELCPDVLGRADAVRVLGQRMRGSESPLDREELATLLLERLARDDAGSVRAAAARGLRGLRTAAARTALVGVARTDSDAEARAAAIEALAEFGPDVALAALADECFATADSWSIAGAWARLRARADPERAFEWLRDALRTRSRHGTLEARVITELAAIDDPRVRPLLVDVARDEDRPDAMRIAAIRELGRRSGGVAEVRQLLAAVLLSDRLRLRREAIDALGAAGGPAAIEILKDHWRTTGVEIEKRAIEDVVARSAGDS